MALVAAPAWATASGDGDGRGPLGASSRPALASPPPPAAPRGQGQGWSRPDIVPRSIRRQGDVYVAATAGGGVAQLTLDPHLQEAAESTLRTYQIPYAGAVVMSIDDGRVLALVGRSEADPALGIEELALTPWAPAASVFKLVSASALLATGDVSPQSRVCYHGGVSSVLAENLVELPRIDRTCATLAYAIGKSQNAIIAKLAARHLSPEALRQSARALGFGVPLPFDLPVRPSDVDVPEQDELELARTAAGFWHSTLSPYHGALLAATIAHDGTMPMPYLIARAVGTEGQPLAARPHLTHAVMAPAAARELAGMMALTTRMGTARHTFLDRKSRPLLPITVAGKTGTLSAETDRGFVGYSWFVGFAPAEKPRIAFAVALGNGAHWRIKAAFVARQIVAAYLAERGAKSESVLAAR